MTFIKVTENDVSKIVEIIANDELRKIRIKFLNTCPD